MAQIAKDYEICYAHRLLNHEGKCSRLHGHNAKITVCIDGPINKDEISSSHGMVIDFGDLDNTIGKWLNEHLDHRTVLEISDPIIPILQDTGDESSLIVLDGPPTAELLATLVFKKVQEFQGKLTNITVTFWETSKACAIISDVTDVCNNPVMIVEDGSYAVVQ